MTRTFGCALFDMRGEPLSTGSMDGGLAEFSDVSDASASSLAGFINRFPLVSGTAWTGHKSFLANAFFAPDSYDPSLFDGLETVTTSVPGIEPFVTDSELESQERLTVAGLGYSPTEGSSRVLVARYTLPSGDLHDSFGDDGVVLTDATGGMDYAMALDIDGQDRIVVGGVGTVGSTDPVFLVLRYHRDGSSDLSFGDGGAVLTDFQNSEYEHVESIVASPKGGVVAAGNATHPTRGTMFALARYDENGALDPTFSDDGRVVTGFGPGSEHLVDAAVDHRGRIVAVGNRFDVDNPSVVVARYRSDGTLDPTFDEDGAAFHDGPDGVRVSASSVRVDGCGRALVAGTAYSSRDQRSKVLLLRFNPDGSLDRTFGDDGSVVADVARTTGWNTADVATHDGWSGRVITVVGTATVDS
jgi:uncharacterized delta-60 repeat protein